VKPVTIARDLGKVVEISAGIEADDRVIQSPPDGIVNGDEVHVAENAAPGAPAAPAASAAAADKAGIK